MRSFSSGEAAFSSHDYRGDDLRRRWDDPELHREGEHVVAFAGAGSHSGAFISGDYVVLVDPARVRPLITLVRKLQRLPALALLIANLRAIRHN